MEEGSHEKVEREDKLGALNRSEKQDTGIEPKDRELRDRCLGKSREVGQNNIIRKYTRKTLNKLIGRQGAPKRFVRVEKTSQGGTLAWV